MELKFLSCGCSCFPRARIIRARCCAAFKRDAGSLSHRCKTRVERLSKSGKFHRLSVDQGALLLELLQEQRNDLQVLNRLRPILLVPHHELRQNLVHLLGD
jgi:hypothetical protein